jgi:hypothetical protein
MADMRIFRIAALVSVALVTGACSALAEERDPLCEVMATFANAENDDGVHTVRLTTDWGGNFLKSDAPDEQLFYAKSCEHDSNPGKALCSYLVENSSTEFAAINYRRALRCLEGNAAGLTDDNRLPADARSRTVRGKAVRSEILATFFAGSDSAPPVLSISAREK